MESTGKKLAPPKIHHEIHSRPATVTTSRRRATKHVPRVSPYSPASIDPGFVEKIGLVQLSQSLKATSVTHSHTDRQLLIKVPCTHPGMKRLFLSIGKKRPRALHSLGLASLPVERKIKQGGLKLAAGRVRSKKN